MKANPLNPEQIAIGSKDQTVQLWDINAVSTGAIKEFKGVQQPMWHAKNLPNDHLDLAIPIFDTDLIFLSDVGPFNLVTCTGYGEIREYDTRQKKPALAVDLFDDNDGKNIFQQKSGTYLSKIFNSKCRP